MQNRDDHDLVSVAPKDSPNNPLRVLVVEDSPADAVLVELELTNSGYHVTILRVDTAGDFSDALARHDWDVIIADYILPAFGAVDALMLLKQSERDIPFIILSGSITDETAVTVMRAGAHDYVLKDNIARLVPAIEREVSESAERRRTKQSLQKSQEKLAKELRTAQLLQQVSTQLIQADNVDALYEQILDAAVSLLHADFASMQMFHPDGDNGGELELLGTRGIAPEDCLRWIPLDLPTTCCMAARTGERVLINDLLRCDFMAGSEALDRHLRVGIRAAQSTPLFSRSGAVVGILSTHWREPHEPDPSELRAFDVLARQAADLIDRKRAQDALRKTEERYRLLIENQTEMVAHLTKEGRRLYVNPNFLTFVGKNENEVVNTDYAPEIHPEDAARVAEQWQRTFEPPDYRSDIEARTMTPQGWRWTSWSNVAVRESDSEPSTAICVGRDITELKLTQEALASSEQRYRSFVEASSQVIWRTNPVGQVDVEIPAWNRYTGQSPEQAQGWGWMQAIAAEDRERVSAAWLNASQTRTMYDVEYCLRRHDGALRQVHARGVPILEGDGSIREWIGTCIDVTEQRQAEAALSASEEKFRAAFQGAAVGIGRVNFADARWMDVNEALCRMVGYTAEEMRAIPWPEITHPEDVGIDLTSFQRMAAGELDSYSVEKRFIHKQGHIVWARLSLSIARDAQGKPDYEIAVVEDITERKRAEEELERSRNELQFALQAAGAGAWNWQVGADHFVLDLESQNLLFMPEDATLRDAFERIVPEDQAQIESELRACAQGLREYAVEFRVRSPQGVVRWIEARGRLIQKEGTPWVYGINQDVTRRKISEQALRQSEERFRAMAANVPEMIWVADAQANFQYLSPKWLQYTGTTAEQNTDGAWANVIHPEDRARAIELWKAAVHMRSTYETEYRVRRYDGEYRWHWTRAVPISDPDSNTDLWFGTTIDIHDQKRAQEALIRSEKLASVGRMAATVAHEINNPLASAINSLFLASVDSSLSATVHQRIELAERELERVAHMTKQTLGFYRETGKFTAVNLSEVVDGIVTMYGPKLKNKSISVQRRIRSNVLAHGIEGELRQIISNLVANSIDAVNGNGILHVRTSSPTKIGSRSMVRLTIADTGAGISPENLKRVFEPFFTTKESIGTGLGLWVTKQLIEKHRGRIRVRSRAGRGTVFSILLPADRRGEVRQEEKSALDAAEQHNWKEVTMGKRRMA